MADYIRLSNIKNRLGQSGSDSLDSIILEHGNDVDSMIDNALRNHLGNNNAAGVAIVLPLTSLTTPAIDVEIQKIADDTVIGLIRSDNANDHEILDRAEKRIKSYLIKRFGYSRDIAFDKISLDGIT